MNSKDFTFKETMEESTQLDFDHMNPCPHCQKPIPHDAITCYYCGKTVNHNKGWLRWAMIIITSIILLRFIASAVGVFDK